MSEKQFKWDRRFLGLAYFIAQWSKDESTKTGAVIVRQDKTICSLGYNGFPANMDDSSGRYDNREQKYSRIIHCEMNALISSKDESVCGYTLYTYPFLSCDRCAVHMIQAGIKRVVAPKIDLENKRHVKWQPVLEKTKEYFSECGVEVVEI